MAGSFFLLAWVATGLSFKWLHGWFCHIPALCSSCRSIQDFRGDFWARLRWGRFRSDFVAVGPGRFRMVLFSGSGFGDGVTSERGFPRSGESRWDSRLVCWPCKYLSHCVIVVVGAIVLRKIKFINSKAGINYLSFRLSYYVLTIDPGFRIKYPIKFKRDYYTPN